MAPNQSPGFDVIDLGQVGIEHDAFAADQVDLRGDAFDRNDALPLGHSVTVAKRRFAVKGPAKNVAPRPWLAYTVSAEMAKTAILVDRSRERR